MEVQKLWRWAWDWIWVFLRRIRFAVGVSDIGVLSFN